MAQGTNTMKLILVLQCMAAVLTLSGLMAEGSGLAFSDPANTIKAPAYAVGQANRGPQLDVLPGFKSPPPGFGAVPFFWWIGDPLTRERLAWELDKLSEHSISGLQINYCHGMKESLDSEPPIYSEEWWKLVEWFAAECKRRGMAISLSDYTKAGRSMSNVIKQKPDLRGYALVHEEKTVDAGPVQLTVGADWLAATAYRLEGDAIQPGSGMDLRPFVTAGKLNWNAPVGRWRLCISQFKRAGCDAMNPEFGAAYADEFFGQFERHLPGEGGKGLNFFFSDELNLGVSGWLWSANFSDEFKKRKGYDIMPELPGLFRDIGPRTPKIRLDYSDVMVALSEEGFFKPVFDWHQQRGMTMGCDHGGRGQDVVEFGDYFRTQRWNQGPGADQPGYIDMGKNLIKAKVASSIAHLYQRPRVWLEGWHSSGWAVSSAKAADALFADYLMGYNMLGIHGLYYTTHGGWWEWAPPCNCFHMPYWEQLGTFMKCSERLSYLFTQGDHVCDLAVLYPVAAQEADLGGKEAVKTSFDAGSHLYGEHLDFDFIDFESIDRARIDQGRLKVSGEAYQVLVLPAMRAIRHSTLEKAAAFAAKGGIVVAVGALPEASDRQGLNDPEVDRLNRELFGVSASEAAALKEPRIKSQPGGGRGIVVRTTAEIAAVLGADFGRDFRGGKPGGYLLHRKIGPRDCYAIYGQSKDEECTFRATGQVELWDPWSGETKPLPVLEQSATVTRLKLPLSEKELQLIVFSPGHPQLASEAKLPVLKSKIALEGEWEFELKPSQDNRWGDYHWPPSPELIGAEARRFRYADETADSVDWEKPDFNDKGWRWQTYSYGAQFWKLGPMPAEADTKALEERVASLEQIDPAVPVRVGGKEYRWTPYEFSWRFGVEGDPGYQGFCGLKERMYDEYIRLGKRPRGASGVYPPLEKEAGGARYYLWSSLPVAEAGRYQRLHGGMEPAAAWLNGAPLAPTSHEADLSAGPNRLLLRYDRIGTGHFTFVSAQSAQQDSVSNESNPAATMTLGTLAMRWHGDPSVLRFDVRPSETKPAGWYRFNSAPGLRAMNVIAHGKLTAWANGTPCTVSAGNYRGDGAREYRVTVASPSAQPVLVALRIEQERGLYGGAAIPEPIKQECGRGRIGLGDWARIDGLRCYSGGAWYRKSVSLGAEQLGGQAVLELGELVSSAEVKINGHSAGIKTAPAWRWEIGRWLKPGENQIEVLIYNTIWNHYQTIPSIFKGASAQSGLIGPVTLELF